MELEIPPKKVLTREEREGNRLFKQEVARLGVDGFVKQQMDMVESEKRDGHRRAEAMIDANMAPLLSKFYPKIGFAHMSQERWDSIFSKKENADGEPGQA